MHHDEEDEALENGWLALDEPIKGKEVFYQSRSTRINFNRYRPRFKTPNHEGREIGFKIIDAINSKFKLSKQKPKFKGLLTTGNINEKKVYAIKPLTFMNNSGICIRELIEYFKIEAENIIVFHDDLDIEFGKIKTKFGGSSAGHNGIESIDKFIGKDYSRVRIGIGKPNDKIAVSDLSLIHI